MQHAIELFFGDQGAHLGVAFKWRSELDLLCFFDHCVYKLAVDPFLDQDAAAGRANFALIDEDAEQCAVDGVLEICVGEEDVRGLAAKL